MYFLLTLKLCKNRLVLILTKFFNKSDIILTVISVGVVVNLLILGFVQGSSYYDSNFTSSAQKVCFENYH